MRIILDYRVPVSVVVDMELAQVAKVVIHDDEMDQQPFDVLDEDGKSIVGTPLAKTATDFADNDQCWPSWQYV